MDSLGTEIRQIIGEVCAIDLEKLDMDADIYKVYGVDSMMAVKILASIDVRYDVELPNTEAAKIKTVNELVELVRNVTQAVKR